jgi:hypothetical protein
MLESSQSSSDLSAPRISPALAPAFDISQWGDRRWRLANLYYIVTEQGKCIKFEPNGVQLSLLDEMWYLNICLKSRQHGISTFVDLLGLDLAVWSPNKTVGIVAQGLREAQVMFRTKVKFPYDHLPEGIREVVYPINDSVSELSLANGSSVYVGTSMRSQTLSFLHISEFGKISRRDPEKAKEIVSGSFNAVHPGQIIFVESTAEGRGGEFFEMCELAQNTQRAGAKLTPLDFRFHFYPWWIDPHNVLASDGVVIGQKMAKYFSDLELAGIKLTAAQKAWYTKKAELQKDRMRSEYPSTARESFEAAVDGVIYGAEMARARTEGRICKVPYARGIPVDTFWDLGLSKTSGTTALWCHQYLGYQHRFLNAYESHGQSLDHYVKWLLDTGYVFGTHYLPHDAGVRRLGKASTKPWIDMLRELMPGHTFKLVPVIDEVAKGIDQTKTLFDECAFDEEHCSEGIKALDNYQYEWDEAAGAFRSTPKHDWTSNYSDALRQFGQGWRQREPAEAPIRESGYQPRDAGIGLVIAALSFVILKLMPCIGG